MLDASLKRSVGNLEKLVRRSREWKHAKSITSVVATCVIQQMMLDASLKRSVGNLEKLVRVLLFRTFCECYLFSVNICPNLCAMKQESSCTSRRNFEQSVHALLPG